MTPAQATSGIKASLPQLSGGLLWIYRAIWCALAIAASAIIAWSFLQPTMQPAVFAMRLGKGIVVIAVSAILLRRRHRDPVAGLLALAFLTWAITSSYDFASTDVIPQLLDRGRFLLFALALLLFPNGDWQPGWTREVAMASAAVFMLGVAETLHVATTHLFLPLAILCVLAAIASLVARFRNTASETPRQQLKWVALGLVSGVGLILCARAGAAAIRMPILWEAMFQLGIILIALGFLISLMRYRLYDAETAISRSAAYAVLTIAVVATFGGTEALIELLGQQYLGTGLGNISGAMAAAVAAVLLSPLHNRISDWAERRFQRDLATLKRTLPDILADQSPKVSSGQIGAVALRMISEAIHATRSALLVDGHVVAAHGIELNAVRLWSRDSVERHAAILERYRSDAVFPLSIPIRSTFAGATPWLLLGPRPDGSLYGKDELDALNAVLPAVRDSLNSAIVRETYLAHQRRAYRRVRQDMAELRLRLTVIEAGALSPSDLLQSATPPTA
jgi:hypothetical protein